MKNKVIYECLQQLIKVYVYAEQQYLQAAVRATSPIMGIFLEKRCFERTDFIEDIEGWIEPGEGQGKRGRTLRQLYQWHSQLYGRASLNNVITDLETILIDEKALEVCHCLLAVEIPGSLQNLLRTQAAQIDGDLRSMVYLKALFEN